MIILSLNKCVNEMTDDLMCIEIVLQMLVTSYSHGGQQLRGLKNGSLII